VPELRAAFVALNRRATRFEGAVIAAAFAGLWIGRMDSAPGFDDTGVTVFALLGISGIAAAIAGRRPWLIALLVGIWIPIFEVPRGAGSAPLFALLFSSVGAGVGYVLGRVLEANA
jgi:hypothetical protein